MNSLYVAALQLQTFFEKQQWRFCIIGGLAVARWGQPRATQDVDVSLLTGFGNEPDYVDAILERFAGRLPDAAEFALKSRVVLAKADNGVPLDIALAAFPFEEQVIERASLFKFADGILLRTASAEDLVILKAFSGREHDWLDIEGIVVRQQAIIDWEYTNQELSGLCTFDGNTAPLDRLAELRRRNATSP